MTNEQWLDEVAKRIADNEGIRTYKYLDSVGVPTIGVGENLDNPGVYDLIEKVGASVAVVKMAPTAKDSSPKNAVASCITTAQAMALFKLVLPEYITDAAQSVTGFDSMPDPVRFVVTDLCYNLGLAGWMGFTNARSYLSQRKYFQAGQDLESTLWFTQTGDRAVRDVQMLKFLTWEPPLGGGLP